jgi:uncharacterized protein YutE (UPF0331/DUF86 family)
LKLQKISIKCTIKELSYSDVIALMYYDRSSLCKKINSIVIVSNFKDSKSDTFRHLIQHFRIKKTTITNSRRIVDTRNRLTHGYDEIEATQIWHIIINHLLLLRIEVTNLINDIFCQGFND